jgi:HTH-type transcriptional regulator / antitoxin HipB
MDRIVDVAQLTTYLAAYRRGRGLTLADLGARLHLSGPRVSQIEQQPGKVSFAQVFEVLSALGVTILLDAPADRPAAPAPPAGPAASLGW